MIEAKGLSKYYGEFPALKGISFQISRGEIVGFLGPNGAGKTTAMRILTGYLKPTAGQATVAGVDVLEHPIEVQKKIGYLPETNPLYQDMVVSDYLDFIGDVRKLSKSRRAERMKIMIKKCGLENVLKKSIGELSKGFRQRVGLAQALIHDPELLILDEPTSGLDPKQIIEIRELIKSLGKEKTVVLSTHILPEVHATCERVVIVNEGSIVAIGNTGELQNRVGSKGTVIARIRGQEAQVLQHLRSISGVSDVRPAADSMGIKVDGIGRYEIRCSEPEETAELIFKAASQNGWALRELHAEQASLEDIFLKLTTKE
ncbi:MAG: ATP-binding cassette domain-containing protein [Nitrospirae bacterium]|nr:ATP-binding cassette domain-containing protein [Nitrospirota bacterium]